MLSFCNNFLWMIKATKLGVPQSSRGRIMLLSLIICVEYFDTDLILFLYFLFVFFFKLLPVCCFWLCGGLTFLIASAWEKTVVVVCLDYVGACAANSDQIIIKWRKLKLNKEMSLSNVTWYFACFNSSYFCGYLMCS